LKYSALLLLIVLLWIPSVASYPANAAILQATFQDMVFGGDAPDYPWSMEPLPYGGFVIITTTQSFNQSHLQRYDGSLWITNISVDGRITSSILYTPPKPAIFYDSALLPDGSLVVVGTTGDYRNAVIARISSNGTPIYYGYLSPGVPVYSIGLTGVDYYNGDIIAVGYFYDLSIYKAIQWLVVLDPNGTVVTSVGFNLGSPYYYPITFALSVQDSLAVVTGYGFTNPGFIIGYNLTSNTVEFAYRIGDSAGDDYYGISISGDDIIIVGTTDDLGGEDASIISISKNGSLNWATILKTNGTDRLFGIYADTQSAYVSGWTQPNVTGYRNDTITAKLNLSNGEVIWYKIVGSVLDDWAYRVYADQIGNVYIVGGYGSPTAYDDIMILRLNQKGNLPYCHLLRNESIVVESYSPSISPISPTKINYATTFTPLSLLTSIPSSTTYRVCNNLVGGYTQEFENDGDYTIILFSSVLILILILYITRFIVRD